MRAAALCAGIGGLERAIANVWPDAELVWTAEMDRHARSVLAHHWPGAVHHGEFGPDGIIDGPVWEELPHVDILTAGFPCTDLSQAGRQAGLDGKHSGVWWHVARAVDVLRPEWVVIENVPPLRRMGLDRVTHRLASLGYVGSWTSLRASDIGACHRRERVFIVARSAAEPVGEQSHLGSGGHGGDRAAGVRAAGASAGQAPDNLPGAGDGVPADTDGQRRDRREARGGSARGGEAQGAGTPAPDPDGVRGEGFAVPGGGDGSADRRSAPHADRAGRGRVTEPHRRPGSDQTDDTARGDADRRRLDTWGRFASAVARWEAITGERAPDPLVTGTKGQPTLNPDLPRWMMGFPAGWMDWLPPTAQKRCAGNAVMPQQGAEGIRRCLEALAHDTRGNHK